MQGKIILVEQDLKPVEEQKQAEELCNQAEALLQHSQPTLEPVLIALRQALELLGENQEPGAVHTRNQVGRLWLLLIEQISDLDEAHATLKRQSNVWQTPHY